MLSYTADKKTSEQIRTRVLVAQRKVPTRRTAQRCCGGLWAVEGFRKPVARLVDMLAAKMPRHRQKTLGSPVGDGELAQ